MTKTSDYINDPIMPSCEAIMFERGATYQHKCPKCGADDKEIEQRKCPDGNIYHWKVCENGHHYPIKRVMVQAYVTYTATGYTTVTWSVTVTANSGEHA